MHREFKRLFAGFLVSGFLVLVLGSGLCWPAPESKPARVLVLTTGEFFAIRGDVEMKKGRVMVFHLEDGALVSLPADRIDGDRTREANARLPRRGSGAASPRASSSGERLRNAAASLDERFQQHISIDLKDADVVDVLRFLTDLAGVNLVVDSEVKGTVTLKLQDVTLEDALHVVLKTMGLGMDRQLSTVWVAPYQRLIGATRAGRAVAR